MLAIFIFLKCVIGVPIVLRQGKQFTVIRALVEGDWTVGSACIILFHSHKGVGLEPPPCTILYLVTLFRGRF